MKKIMLALAVAVLAVAANAASFKWSGVNVYGSDGITKFTGTASLYAEGIDGVLSTAAVNAGSITATTFSNDALVGGTTYNFYFVVEDDGKTFTSATKSVAAQATSTVTIGFANMTSQTQNAANWTAADVPEPTSGLLLLLGVAGLALRRKQK